MVKCNPDVEYTENCVLQNAIKGQSKDLGTCDARCLCLLLELLSLTKGTCTYKSTHGTTLHMVDLARH